jgi:hypothetical protein
LSSKSSILLELLLDDSPACVLLELLDWLLVELKKLSELRLLSLNEDELELSLELELESLLLSLLSLLSLELELSLLLSLELLDVSLASVELEDGLEAVLLLLHILLLELALLVELSDCELLLDVKLASVLLLLLENSISPEDDSSCSKLRYTLSPCNMCPYSVGNRYKVCFNFFCSVGSSYSSITPLPAVNISKAQDTLRFIVTHLYIA